MKIKTYSELIQIDSFIDRFRYLKIDGGVGIETFGFNRYLNQQFYKSKEWRKVRDFVIVRDNGCDLAIPDREILGIITIHHLIPITEDDIINRNPMILDPEFLVCVSDNTHKAIHYSDETILFEDIIERKPYDTCPWR